MSFVNEPIQYALLKGNQRTIGDIAVDVILSESTTDKVTVTRSPVQQGAALADHAFKEPVSLNMTVLMARDINFSTGGITTLSLSEIYDKFLKLLSSFALIQISTPKRVYKNMMLTAISNNTDKSSENILSLNLGFEEILTARIQTVTVDKKYLKQPKKTEPIKDVGKKQVETGILKGIFNKVSGGVAAGSSEVTP